MAKVKVKKYKLKTHRGAAKRFKLTASGKVRFRHANRNHIRTKRSAKQVRQGRKDGVASKPNQVMIARMLQGA